jgi:hypothetical protein
MSGALIIRIKKNADGRTSLSCTRADGTTTWQRQQGAQAAFFPRHDLTHYAVETTLGLRHGFFGMVAEGWELTDFGTPWPRGHLPPLGNLSEMIVGFFDQERASGHLGGAADLNDVLAGYCEEHGLPAPTFSEAEISGVRRKLGELFRQWDQLPFGATLELSFDTHAFSAIAEKRNRVETVRRR